ncbi:MAG: hypothetical protein PVF54_07155 [Anaerolineae bacterium]|jgi:hypothetical protein
MAELRIPASLRELVKPTLDTAFHIDYGWWEKRGLDISVELRSHLCAQHKEAFGQEFDTEEKIDWVDERTGEVRRVNGLQHALRIHCSKQPDYINDDLPVVDAVFRAFLVGGNKPLAARELASITGRYAERILRTLTGQRVYKGIRPVR